MSTDFILGIVFLCLAGLTVTLKKAYFELPVSELKKRKALGEETPNEVIECLSYGPALRSFLWLTLGLTLSVSLTMLVHALPVWLSIIVLALIAYFVFSYLPNTRVSHFDIRLIDLLSPGINWILKRTAKYLNMLYKPLSKYYSPAIIPVFDEQDLMAFLKDLSRQNYHRIEPQVFLDLERSAAFGRKRVIDLMVPAKKVKTLLETDVIGPILINELHESKEGYAFVRAEAKGSVTGLLAFNDLSIRSQGRVSGHMRKEVFFINQNDLVYSVIKAFYESKSTVFVVVNDDQKFVGAISLEDVVKQLTGSLKDV